jgi:hypothetical protein
VKPQKRLSEQQVNDCMKLTALMRRAFKWEDTPDGTKYWSDICAKINWMTFYGTTDGKVPRHPIVWRIATDEDARLRPLCRVRDSEDEIWQDGKKLIAVLNRNCPFLVVGTAANGVEYLSSWVYCEIIEDSKTEPAA